jgi:hypothetical protein
VVRAGSPAADVLTRGEAPAALAQASCHGGGCTRRRTCARKRLGHVAVDWLGLCWISTVILGIPVLEATVGKQFAQLGVIAGISSFLFQLPVRSWVPLPRPC